MSHWIYKTNIYHIYPLSFCGFDILNKDYSTTPGIYKVIYWIPHLKSLNINAIYFSPIFEAINHGYDTTDYFTVDRRYGTNDDFKVVAKKLKENGIRIILDGVFNHVGREFFAFKDLIKNTTNSIYKDWFSGIDFSKTTVYKDKFSYECWNGHYNLVKLNLYNNNVVNYLHRAIKMWIEEFDIDGIRFDVVDCLPLEFLRGVNHLTKSIKPDFWLMGEMIHGDYSRFIGNDLLDSITNYQCYKGIYSAHNDRNYFEIAHNIENGVSLKKYLYNFVDNHDVTRLSTILKNKDHLECCYSLLYTMYGVPSIYYGSEFGITGKKGTGFNADFDIRPNIELTDIENGNKDLVDHISKLGYIRLNNEAIQKGLFQKMDLRNQTFLYKRVLDQNEVYIALNISDLDYPFFIKTNYEKLIDLLTNKIYETSNGVCVVSVPKNKSIVLKEYKN